MVSEVEDWFTLPDGMKLYTKTWKPDGQPNAVLVFLHGFSDHCNAYYNLFPTLSSSAYSIQVHSFDQRGWGRSVQSPTQKGLTGPTSLVLSDIHNFVLHVSSLHDPSTPLFLMGHSMGGAEALLYLLSPPSALPSTTQPRPQIQGLLLEAPFIAMDPSAQPSALTVYAGKLASRVLPNRQLLQKLDSTYMSHSKQVRDDWVNDALCHDTGTLEGLAGLLNMTGNFVSLSNSKKVDGLTGQKLPCPVWWSHGDGDKVTDWNASKKLFEVLQIEGGEKEWRNFDGAYHKIHAEPDGVGDLFAREVGEWILKRSKTVNGGEGDVKSKL